MLKDSTCSCIGQLVRTRQLATAEATERMPFWTAKNLHGHGHGPSALRLTQVRSPEFHCDSNMALWSPQQRHFCCHDYGVGALHAVGWGSVGTTCGRRREAKGPMGFTEQN